MAHIQRTWQKRAIPQYLLQSGTPWASGYGEMLAQYLEAYGANAWVFGPDPVL